MKSDTQNIVTSIRKSLSLLNQRLEKDSVRKRLQELNAIVEDPDLWKDPASAQSTMKERQLLTELIAGFDELESELRNNLELLELGEDESDEEIVHEAELELVRLLKIAKKKEVEALLGGEADKNSAFLEIKAGAGGVESCDWAQMLSRMYERWAARHGYKFEVISENRDAEAGLKSVTTKVIGLNAYGWLKTEFGVHRLVRISPFDSAARRHTSFSSVGIYPVLDESIEVEINPADLRVDTYRSSGAGGQHVNTTDSAVRITHIPTGIVVTSSEKSQHMNRANCMEALKSRLYELEIRRRSEMLQEQHMQKGDAGWGNQIRSYVLAPYQMVKDLRTNFSTSNAESVLDGNLDDFMSAALANDVVGKSRAEALGE